MKKSDLKKYIRENILLELSESTEDEINKTKELTQAVQDLESAKKEAGIEEGAIDPAEYGDIGAAYLAGFGKPNSLDLDQLEALGRKIVKQIYKGDFDKAKAKFIKEASYSNQYVDKSRIASNKYQQANAFKASYDGIGQVSSEKQFDDDNIDKKAVKGAKKNKGLAKAKEELALLTREMKSLAKKYSKAEGEDKEKLVKILKDKTKLKKELESIIDK
jgi:hypothetical protein